MIKNIKQLVWLLSLFLLIGGNAFAQSGSINWTKDGNGFYEVQNGNIVLVSLPKMERKQVISNTGLRIQSFQLSPDGSKVLIFTNAKKVWRYNTRGDYYVANLSNGVLKQVGKDKPASSLMFAKFSPNGQKVAYVSGHNLYVEDLANNVSKALTSDGTDHLINGTFDWVYEEEFDCRDGFRWSPDNISIAYWQLDASKTKNFLMINNTDSIYPYTIPVEYPKVGENPSSAKIGIVNVETAKTTWLKVPGDNIQHYIPRMDWIPGSNEVILEQLNREQNTANLFICDAASGIAKNIYTESDKAWIDVADGFEWVNENKDLLWQSEKDGWRHIYRISRDGKKQTLITKGNFDVIEKALVDEKDNTLYFFASPTNATQRYLYKTKLDGKGSLDMVTSAVMPGTHDYEISPNGMYARHTYQSASIRPLTEWMNLSTGNPFFMDGSITSQLGQLKPVKNKATFFKIKTEDGVELDGWMKKPDNFNENKKYPVLFYVYGEPASQTVKDTYGIDYNRLYQGDLAKDGYITISLENRGAPAPKGREWRKAIYKNIGVLNIRDQAMGAKKIMEWPFIDKDRVAVYGWSGGGSSTLNLLFQYPEIYKTGIAIAAVANQLTYDNIYQERYMGSPLQSKEAYIKGSPISHVQGLKGNLLYIHGTGDDNVHYQNAEMLINELVKNGKAFQLMSYPNRTHSINEGAGTSNHLALTFTNFLRQNCPPGEK
jgi:dipeptidyl-peptidase-4